MIGRTNQSRSQEETRHPSHSIRFVWQDDKADASSYKTEASAQPIKSLWSILRTNPQDGIVVSANHIQWSDYLWKDYLRTDDPSRRNRRLSQSHPSVRLSLDGLSLDGSSFRLNRRLSQSQPLVGLSSVGLSLDGISSDGSSFG